MSVEKLLIEQNIRLREVTKKLDSAHGMLSNNKKVLDRLLHETRYLRHEEQNKTFVSIEGLF
jgi:hypothetical protein